MADKLCDFLNKLKIDKKFNSFDEAAIKQGVVLKILSFLDWDPFDMDEIQPEYEANGGRVDFSLRHENAHKVFILVKKEVKDFKKYQEQLSGFAVKDDVKMTVLTDGMTWWFSLPLFNGSIEETRFQTLALNDQQADDVTNIFYDFLSKKNITSGKAVKNAEDLVNNRIRTMLIIDTLPKAWNKIMSEPETWLYDVLAEKTKEICGHKPDTETIEKYIALEMDEGPDLSNILKPKKPSPPITPTTTPEKKKKAAPGEDYAGKNIASFSFKGTKHDVKSWKEMLLKVCEIISTKHKDDFETVLTLSSRNREYFSTNPYALLTSEKISGTDLFVDVNLSEIGVVALSHKIIKLFGYEEEDLSIDVG